MIKKALIFTLFSISSLFANEYMAQLKPIKEFEIKAQSSGVVTFVDKNLEATYLKKEATILKIDSEDEDIELAQQKDLYKVQKEIVDIKEKNYNSKARVTQLSLYNKNVEKLSLLEAKKELVNTKKAIRTLENNKTKKLFKNSNIYLGKIYKQKGEFVNVADKIYDAYDFSEIKIELYLTLEEIKKLKTQTILIDGKASEFELSKVYKIKDTNKISRYKVELTKPTLNEENFFFGKVVKVEFR